MIKKWKRLSTKQVFSHPRHTVFIDDVELPSGDKTTYLHFGADGNDSAMVLAQREDGKFLLQKEYSYPPDEVLLQCPGGVIDKGESPEEGALRELAEEAKLSGTLTKLGWMYTNNRRTSGRMHFFLAANLSKVHLDADPEEIFEDHWYTEQEIDALIKSNEIRNYSALCGWTFYKTKKG